MIQKKLSTLAICLFSLFILNAQTEEEKYWKFKGTPSINFSQSSFTNWVAGGVDVTAITFDAKLYLDYKKDKFGWNNYLNMEYGLNRQKIEGIRKMVDKIDFQSDLNIESGNEDFRYSASLNFKTQFDNGYDYKSVDEWQLTSAFMAPGYVTLSLGMEYTGVDGLVISALPLTGKTTIVSEKYYDKKVRNEYFAHNREDFFSKNPTNTELLPTEQHLDSTLTTYGLDWRENVRFETGLKIAAVYTKEDLFKNFDLKTRLSLFASYTDFLNPDINWELWLSYKFNNYLAFNINSELLYDADMLNDDGYAKVQFRNVMGVGITYTF